MKHIICWLLGHRWRYEPVLWLWICTRCGDGINHPDAQGGA
jgi:hypothetical protein